MFIREKGTPFSQPSLKFAVGVLPIVKIIKLKIMKITTESVMLKKSKSGNYYFRNGNGIVIVDQNVAARWDDLDSVTTQMVKYEKRMNEQGQLVDDPWEREEVVSIEDTTRKIAKKTRRLEVATAYAKALDASLKVSDLGDVAKKELEALLG